jgi:hypothetical protein
MFLLVDDVPMTDDQWAKDHADGMHQREIVALMRKIDPALQGHERAIILIALMRTSTRANR